jgi:D-amino-acid dehydrogenase
VNFAVLDGQALAAAEPHLLVERAGALHWTDPSRSAIRMR